VGLGNVASSWIAFEFFFLNFLHDDVDEKKWITAWRNQRRIMIELH